MDDRSPNSRNSHRNSRSVVFPRIRGNSSERNARATHGNNDNTMDDQLLGDHQSLRSKSQREDRRSSNDFNAYILEKLEFNERMLEEERRGRILIEDNLRAIVVNVQRLSKDMALLQQQIKSDEDNAHSQNVAMKNLELHQMAGIGDVWNRLTLGDLNSIKLSGDLNKVSSEVSDLKRSEEDVHRRLNKLQNVVDSLVTKLEKANLDFEKNLQILKVKSETQNQSIDEKIKGMQTKYEGARHPDSEQKVQQQYSELLGNVEHRLDTSLERQKTWQESFEGKVEKLEERLSELMQMKHKKDEDLVRQIQEASVNQHAAFKKSQQKLKDNYREAFRAVYESITTMQTVLEAKLKMTEADLKTSINSIMRTISHH